MNDTQKTILVVEDDDFLIGALKMGLAQEDINFIEANDGEQGYDTAMREQPDMVLTDIMMPLMDGMEMARRIRKDEVWGESVPITFITNIGSPGREDEAALMNADYIIKANARLADIIAHIKEKLA